MSNMIDCTMSRVTFRKSAKDVHNDISFVHMHDRDRASVRYSLVRPSKTTSPGDQAFQVFKYTVQHLKRLVRDDIQRQIWKLITHCQRRTENPNENNMLQYK